jgi:hypothetical protein
MSMLRCSTNAPYADKCSAPESNWSAAHEQSKCPLVGNQQNWSPWQSCCVGHMVGPIMAERLPNKSGRASTTTLTTARSWSRTWIPKLHPCQVLPAVGRHCTVGPVRDTRELRSKQLQFYWILGPDPTQSQALLPVVVSQSCVPPQ